MKIQPLGLERQTILTNDGHVRRPDKFEAREHVALGNEQTCSPL